MNMNHVRFCLPKLSSIWHTTPEKRTPLFVEAHFFQEIGNTFLYVFEKISSRLVSEEMFIQFASTTTPTNKYKDDNDLLTTFLHIFVHLTRFAYKCIKAFFFFSSTYCFSLKCLSNFARNKSSLSTQ